MPQSADCKFLNFREVERPEIETVDVEEVERVESVETIG